MHLSKDEVKKVAKLANLPIEDSELEKYSSQLSAVLDYIDQLNEVDTKDVEPTFNVSGQINVLKKDESVPGLTQDQSLQNTEVKKDGSFVVKRIIGGE